MAVNLPSSHKAPRGHVVSIWETLKEMIWFEKEQKQNNNLISNKDSKTKRKIVGNILLRTNGVQIVGLAGRETKLYEAVSECRDSRYKIIK